MRASQRGIVEKADIAVSNLISCGGYLNPMQSNTFIRMIIEQPTLLNLVRTVPMSGPTMQVNKIGFTSRILNAAPADGDYLASGNRARPTTNQVNLKTEEVYAEVHIPYDVLEDNIERGALEDTIMTLIAERAATDLEELIIEGDEAAGADAYLQLMDGVLVLAYRHLCAFSSAAVTKSVFKDMVKCMPNKYLRYSAMMRYFLSPHADIEYSDSLSNRETGLGDAKVERRTPNWAYGIQTQPVALMPNAQALLTFPKNIIWGVQRRIMIETDRDIRAQVLIVVLTMRCDLQFEEDDGVVKATGLAPDAGITCTEVDQVSCVTGPCAASISC